MRYKPITSTEDTSYGEKVFMLLSPLSKRLRGGNGNPINKSHWRGSPWRVIPHFIQRLPRLHTIYAEEYTSLKRKKGYLI